MAFDPLYAMSAVPFLETADTVRLLSLVGKQISLECHGHLDHFLQSTRRITVDLSSMKCATGIRRFKNMERIDFTFGPWGNSSLSTAAELIDCGVVRVGFVVSDLCAPFQTKLFMHVVLKLLPPRVSTLDLVVDASIDLETSEYIIRCIPKTVERFSLKHTYPPLYPADSDGADWGFALEPETRPSVFDLFYEHDLLDNSMWISLWLRSMPRGCKVAVTVSIRRLLTQHLIEFLVDVHCTVELSGIVIGLLRIVVGRHSEYSLLRQWHDFYNDIRGCAMLPMLPTIEFSYCPDMYVVPPTIYGLRQYRHS